MKGFLLGVNIVVQKVNLLKKKNNVNILFFLIIWSTVLCRVLINVAPILERYYLERSSVTELSTYIAIIFVCVFLYAISDYLKICFLAMRLSGPAALPIIGNCFIIKEKDLLNNRMATAYKLYGPVARVWLFFFPFFVVLDPQDLQVVLSSKKHTDKSFLYKLLHNFLGNGLITSSGAKWSFHRKLIQPTFHLTILEKFIDTFADSSECLLEKLKESSGEINVTQFVNNCVLDILNEAVLGVPVKRSNKNDMEESPFRQGKVVVPYRITRPWLLFNFFYKMTETAAVELNQKQKLNEFSRSMITKRRNAIKSGVGVGRKSLLDYMIELSENNPEFTEEDIINEACTFMLAGQDSVGAAVAFCLFSLARHQDHQNKCIAELENIFDGDDRVPNMQDLREMRYLEQCIKETLRLYPSVPVMARRIGEDIQIGKHSLPAGCEVLILPYATHRLAHVYPDPEKFDPNRFSEHAETRNPYAFIPFSAGPRNCIGYKFAYIEMKTIISKILRHYHLLPVPGKTEIEPMFRVTLRAKGGLWVKLVPRNNNNSKMANIN